MIGNGNIATGEQAAGLLERGELDLVAIGKAALGNHDWPRRVEQGAPLTAFDYAMFVPMATVTNELAWRQEHDRPPMQRPETAPCGALRVAPVGFSPPVDPAAGLYVVG